jgi:hypothetical protein
MSYHYWILRYVPNAVREEFINIGVIVGHDADGDWAMRRIHELGRANRLGGDPRLAGDWLLRLEQVIKPTHSSIWALTLDYSRDQSAERPSFSWIDRIQRHSRNNFRLSEPKPIRAASAAEAAELLFNTLVLMPKEVERRRERPEAVRELYRAMHTYVPDKDLQRHVNLTAGRQRTRFEFAVGRERIAQLSQIWAFNVKHTERLNQSIQASGYAVARLRRSGGLLVNPGRKHNNVFDISTDVALRVVYIPPENAEQKEVFRIAEDSWNDLGMQAFPHGQEEQIAKEAQALIGLP